MPVKIHHEHIQQPRPQYGLLIDGIVIILPDQPLGYYAEYTVATPGVDHRGARRIVTGDGGEYYYTDDHYTSFQRIDGWPE